MSTTFTSIFVTLILFLGAASFLELLFDGIRGFAILFWLFVIIAIIYGFNNYDLTPKNKSK